VEVTVLKEEARGCGYRHSGKDGVGLYLMGGGIFEICERLPFPVGVCPTCGEGTKFSRGFTWITANKLFGVDRPPKCFMDVNTIGIVAEAKVINHNHAQCLMCNPPDGKHGLMWVGEKFYTPGTFLQEAVTRGISKRISTFPTGFKFGETIVYLAHKKAYALGGKTPSEAAVFTVFKPDQLDLVVDTTDPDKLPKRALSIAKKLGDSARIVKIEPPYEQQDLLKGME
jgi:hypothetical protein